MKTHTVKGGWLLSNLTTGNLTGSVYSTAPQYFSRMKERRKRRSQKGMNKAIKVNNKQKVVIVPCSGIGKTYGTVSREAAYEVVENVRPGQTHLVALSLLVLGDENSRELVVAEPGSDH